MINAYELPIVQLLCIPLYQKCHIFFKKFVRKCSKNLVCLRGFQHMLLFFNLKIKFLINLFLTLLDSNLFSTDLSISFQFLSNQSYLGGSVQIMYFLCVSFLESTLSILTHVATQLQFWHLCFIQVYQSHLDIIEH